MNFWLRGGGYSEYLLASAKRVQFANARTFVSLLVSALLLLFLQSTAFAVSPSEIYEDELNGATVQSDTAGTFPFTSAVGVTDIVLIGAPSGLTVSSVSRVASSGVNRRRVNVTFSFTGNITSDTTVTMRAKRYILIGAGAGSDVGIGSFTIKPTVKEIRTSTPTNSSTVTEAGSTSTFTVRLGAAPSGDVTVAVSVSDTTEASVSPNSLTFTSSNYNTTQTVTVTGKDDSIYDSTQNYNIVLNPSSTADSGYNGLSNVNVAMSTTDNESAPSFSIDSPSVAEGDSGSVNLVFTVTLSPTSTQQVTVNYADAGTGTATSGTDYTAIAGGTLTFAAGETSKTITVSVTGDTSIEMAETVVLTLSNASSGTSIATGSGTGTITDNDTPDIIGFSIDSPSVTEGDSGSVNLTFTVSLSPASGQQVTVDYADAGTGTATSGTDYTAIADGTLTFAAGDTSKTIAVLVTGDTLDEMNETVVITLSNASSGVSIAVASGTGTIADNDALVQGELDMKIVAEVAREITTSVVTAVSSRIASVVGGASIVPPTGGFADGGLLSILERYARHSRERERGLERSEMSLYRSLDGASFVYTSSVATLGANGPAEANGSGISSAPTVWGSVDYRKLSGSGADALQWDGELASVNVGTDAMVDAGVLVGLAAGMSKGSFSYQGSTGGTSGVVSVRVKSLNPYIGWSVSESASLWAAVGYGKGKVSYNDSATGETVSNMSVASAALGGRYRLHSNDGTLCTCLIQVDLKGDAWGLQTKVDGDERRPMGSKSRAHGVRVAVERLQSSALESGASLTLSGEAGLRWDGGDGDTGTGIEIGGTADYRNPATRVMVVATGRVLLDHESDRKEWGAGLTAGYRLESRETGLTYRSNLSHGRLESGVDSLWDSSVASRTSEDEELTTRMDAEVGYRMFGVSGLHTPYVGFGVEEGNKRDYRIGMRYTSESALSSGLEFERREADGKRPDHRIMLTGQMDW